MNHTPNAHPRRYDLTTEDILYRPNQMRSMYLKFWGLVCLLIGGLSLPIFVVVVGWPGIVATLKLQVMDLGLVTVLVIGLGLILAGSRKTSGHASFVELGTDGLALEWNDGKRRFFPWNKNSPFRVVEAGPASQRLTIIDPTGTPKWSFRNRGSFETPLTEEAARAIIREAEKHGKDVVRRVWIRSHEQPGFTPKPDEDVLFWEYRVLRPGGRT